MTDRYIEHDGLKFRVRMDMPTQKPGGPAPWIVCSNSLATNLTLWDDLVAAFAPRYRILRYDQRGHGGTTVPPAPATIEQLADDADALMAAHGVQDATFVGVSMGAATGLCAAARPGSRIARLVAADGNAATPPGGAAAWADRLAYAAANGMAAFAELTIPRWFAPASIEAGHPAIPRVRAMIETTPPIGLVACASALQSYDLTGRLPGIRQPTLLIAGAHDGVMPASMRKLSTHIAGARYAEIPAAGHLPCIEQPAAFIAEVEAFLS
jgi:3-oxoadipate enol-lactonase